MNRYEKFIVSPDRLSDVMCAILKQEIPETFNCGFLTAAGIDEPNSTLYISLFQNLGLVDEDERPTKTYGIFHRSEENARKVIARQMSKQTYSAVFEGNEKPWLLPDEEVRELFQDLMGEKKSATFVRLVTRTFQALADFADWEQTEPEIPETAEAISVAGEEIAVAGGDVAVAGEDEVVAGDDISVACETQVPKELAETTPLDRAVSPHEEFILELMNDQAHTYAYHSFSSGRNREKHASAPQERNGMEHASAHHLQNGSHVNDISGNGTHENGKHINGKSDNGIHEYGSDDNGMEEIGARVTGSPRNNHFGQTDERNDDIEHPQDQQTLFIQAMIRRAVLLKQMERLNEAVVAFDQIIRYADRRYCQIDQRKVISAYYNKAQLLERLEQQEEALAIYEQMIGCFASSN